MAMTKLNKTFDQTPIKTRYKFKKANPEYGEKIIEKGHRFTGKFLTTLKRDVTTDDGKFTFLSHLFDTNEEGKITIDGCTVLNQEMAKLPKQTPVEITYLGKGKVKKPGQKPPFLFDISADLEATAAKQTQEVTPEEDLSEEVDETEEEFDDEVPFN